MFKLIRALALCTTALVPVQADAAPLAAALAAGTILGSTIAFSVVLSLSVSLALTGLQLLLTDTPSVPQLRREIAAPSSRPAYRFAYGRCRIAGSPAPWRVQGAWLYGCLILNSRPSAGNVVVYFDKREVTIESGDIYDFEAGGAICTVEGSSDQGAEAPRMWLGLGDQTSPPDWILDEAPDIFEATDGWQGRTVLWLALHCGNNKIRSQRWPATPPLVEVLGDWSRIWDPSDPAQDPDDPATWEWSDNQALCLLDALRNNPVQGYRLSDLHLDSFVDGRDIAAESIPLFYEGGTEDRYTANGFILWRGGEIMDQVQPLAAAGAGRLVRIGSSLGYAPGAWRAPTYTATDILAEGGVDFQTLAPGRDIPRGIRASYIAPTRDWQEAELPATAIPGGLGLLGDEDIREIDLTQFVSSPTQGMRVQKIEGNRLGAQKRLNCMLSPDSINLVAGATMTMGLPAAFARLNGTYEAASTNPGFFLQDEGGDGAGVAFRNPVTLRESVEAHYDWTPATDEFEIVSEAFSGARPDVNPPGTIALATGESVAKRGTPRIRYEFAPGANVDFYEMQFRIDGEPWGDTLTIPGDQLDGGGDVFGYIAPVIPNENYDIRVRSVLERGRGGDVSSWVSASITALAADVDLSPPTEISATGGVGNIVANFRAPNSEDFKAIEVFGSDTDDIGDAAALTPFVYGAPNAVLTYTESGLGETETRFYWARSRGPSGSLTAFSGYVTAATETP